MNKNLLYAGAALFLVGAIVNAVFQGTTGFGVDPIGGGIFGFAAFLGLILIVVGAVKSDRPAAAAQQQQQQIVVYTQPPATRAAPFSLRCPTCKTLNETDARYCMECGKVIPAPKSHEARRSSGKPKKG